MGVADTLDYDPAAVDPRGKPVADGRPAPSFMETARASYRLSVDDNVSSDIRDRDTSYKEIFDALPPASQERIRGSMKRAQRADTAFFYANVWGEAQRLRTADPRVFKSLPKTADEFEAEILNRAKRSRAVDRDITSRGGLIANLSGGVAASFVDPINLGAMSLTGGSAGVVSTMAREAAVNGGISVVQAPFTYMSRKRYGEEYTLPEAAIDVVANATAGALFAGAAKGIEIGAPKVIGALDEKLTPFDKKLARALVSDTDAIDPVTVNAAVARVFDAEPDGSLAASIRAAVPAERLTPELSSALHVLERNAEVDGASPFTRTFAGDEAHRAALARAMSVLQSEAPAPALAPVAGARTRFMARVRQAESSGSDTAVPKDLKTGRLLSSAVGRYQFTEGTWLQYYARAFGKTGESRATILAKRTDGALQDKLMSLLTADNARALGRAGEAETAGNLYLAHFLGSGDAVKVLRAGDDIPVRDLLPAKTVRANRFLAKMSVSDLVAWAAKKMDETPLTRSDRPVLRAEEFGDDLEAFHLAQRETDEAAIARLGQEADERYELPELDRQEPSAIRADAAESLSASDFDPDAAPLMADVSRSDVRAESDQPVDWRAAVDQLRKQADGEVPAALYNPATGPIDVVWGKAPKGKSDGFGLAKIEAKHPEVVQDLPNIVRSMDVLSETPNRIRLESPDHMAVVRVDWDGQKKTWLLTAFEKNNAPAIAEDGRAIAGGRDGSPDLGAGARIAEKPLIDNAVDDTQRALISNQPSKQPNLEAFSDPNGEGPRLAAQSLTHDAAMIAPDGSFRLDDSSTEHSAADILRQLDRNEAEIADIRSCMTPPKLEGPTE